MNKKFLNLILCGALMSSSTGMFTSCKNYDEDIAGLDDRITAVEKSLNELKAQISGGAVITNVESTAKGVKVTLSNGKTFELTNGQDGAKGDKGDTGAAGQPGSVVEIGKNGNWVIDGIDTGKPSRGDKGDKGDKGDQGDPGSNGQDADQVYYVPGVDDAEKGYWVKVTEPADGSEPIRETTADSWLPSGTVTAVWDAENGYLVLNNVDGSEEPVQIQLFGALQSLAFVPSIIESELGMGAIDFYSIWDNAGVVLSNNAKATYRLNPNNAKVSDIQWSFIDRSVTTRVAGDATDLLGIEGEPVSDNLGGLTFDVVLKDGDKLDALNKANKEAIVALRASNGESEIVSDYAVVKKTDLKDFAIIDKIAWDEEGDVEKYSTTEPANNANVFDATLLYTGELDLLTLVETYEETELQDLLSTIGVEPEYVFSKPATYLGSDETNQQVFVTLDGSTVKVSDEYGSAAINRTPIFKVSSQVAGREIASCYIKVKITKNAQEPQGDFNIVWNLGNIEYTTINAATGNNYVYAWEDFNSKILNELDIDMKEFAERYNEPTNDIVAMPGVSVINDPLSEVETTTEPLTINVTNQVLVNNGAAKKIVITYTAKDNMQDKNVIITVNFAVVDNCKLPTLSDNYLIAANTVGVKGKLVGTTYELHSTMVEHFTNYLADYTVSGNHDQAGMVFELYPVGQVGATVTSTGDYKTQEIQLTETFKVGEASRDYKVRLVIPRANGQESCVVAYTVRFFNPFAMSIDPITLKTTNLGDSAEIAPLVVIRDIDGNVVYENEAFTAYAKQVYNLDATSGITFNYDIEFGPEFGSYLTLSDDTVTWDNGGALLVNNLTAESIVTITVPGIADLKGTGTITVLSSENSKN